MDTLLDQISGIAETSRSIDAQPFRIVIIYENIVSAARALRACEILRGEIPQEASLEIGVWKMDALASIETRRDSAKAAARADVLIIAASGVEERPSHFRTWVDEWLADNGAAGTALFTLLGDYATPGVVSFASWLQDIATTNGIDSFSHPSVEGLICAPLRDIPLLMPARELPRAVSIPIEEWRPGSPAISETSARDFDMIENFDAHLRAHLQELRLGTDAVQHQENPDNVLC